MDVHLSLWYVDLDSGKPVRVAKDRYYGLPDLGASWSPDSKWLAYGSRLDNYMSAVHVYSLADGKSTQVTDGMSDANDPVWDRSGKYLFFTASTDSGSSLQPDIQAMMRTPTSSIYLIVLDKDDYLAFEFTLFRATRFIRRITLGTGPGDFLQEAAAAREYEIDEGQSQPGARRCNDRRFAWP